jgi:hypothetical protein
MNVSNIFVTGFHYKLFLLNINFECCLKKIDVIDEHILKIITIASNY